MLNSINSDLIRGHIDTIILSVLHEGDRYGYDILGEIEKKSNGQYSLKQPTLYSCLKRLEGQGFIYKYWGAETNGGRRTYYSLTEMGKELFKKNKDEWEHSRGIIDRLISSPDSPVMPYIVAEVPATPAAENPQNEEQTLTKSTTETDVNIVNDFTDSKYSEILAEAEKSELLDQTNSFTNSDESTSSKSVSYADKLKEDAANEKHEDAERDSSLIDSVYMSDNVSEYFKDYEDDETDTENIDFVASESEDTSTREEITAEDRTDNITEEETLEEEKSELVDEENYSDKEVVRPDYDDKNNLFRSYNNAELSEEADREIIVAREYRNVIRRLLKGDYEEQQFPDRDKFAVGGDYNESMTQVAASVTESENEEYYVQDDGKADFSNLLVAVRSMGDDIRIRTHNNNTDKEYSNLYHYYSNKLLLYKYGILFLLMICEIIIPYLIIKFAIGLEIKYEILTLVISVVGAAILPIYAVSANLIDTYKKKRYAFELKNSLLFRFAVMILMLVLTYALNVVLYMDISFDSAYALSLTVPALLSTNIPLSAVIFQALYDSKKFNAE